MAGAATTDKLNSPLDIIWQFDYAIDIGKLRDMYSKAKRDQWNADVDIDWTQEIDPGKSIIDDERMPFKRAKFWDKLSKSQQETFNANNAAFILSQFLHGEQGALMVAAELVDAVPDYEGKLYAATQVMDEARHVEVFERYVQKLAKVYPIEPFLKKVIDATLTTPVWQNKLIGMQMIVEGLALGSFINMRTATQDPLLKQLLEYVIKDEARHVGYGNVYVNATIADIDADTREQVEDFTYDALIGMRQSNGTNDDEGLPRRQNAPFAIAGYLQVVEDSGVDPNDFIRGMMEAFQDGSIREGEHRPGQVHTFKDVMMPSIARVGVVSERMVPKYEAAGIKINRDTTTLDKLEQEGGAYGTAFGLH